MKIFHFVLLLIFALGMGIGQILFKVAAQRNAAILEEQGGLQGMLALASDGFFWIAAILYGVLTIYWVWLLSFLPLSRAYPATFFSLLFVTAGGVLFLHEPLNPLLLAGLFFLSLGILLVALS
ncbi:hypothetical protein LJC46_07710 [Desulfovibrio sp. OttesenSCG-928-G15]|nr:hypothetical protein [Desulfovibrio sp. OttesenSCG-928-G15]